MKMIGYYITFYNSATVVGATHQTYYDRPHAVRFGYVRFSMSVYDLCFIHDPAGFVHTFDGTGALIG